tara:strand:- start:130 stop:249 length:120 start_codon:yes stop_codon:yes gene_type:complete
MTEARCARAIYWKAPPGQFDACNAYLRESVGEVDFDLLA